MRHDGVTLRESLLLIMRIMVMWYRYLDGFASPLGILDSGGFRVGMKIFWCSQSVSVVSPTRG